MMNDYEGLLESWKVQLIVERAKRKGFRAHEIEDALQEIVLALLNYQYDPNQPNGGSEKTAVTSLIDKNLTFIQRTRARHAKHVQKYGERLGSRKEEDQLDWSQAEAEHRIDLRYDMATVGSRMKPLEREICTGLSQGKSRLQIAKSLGLTPYRLDRIIDEIADVLREAGLEECR